MEQEKTVFSKIIDRELEAYILFEDEQCMVILDVFPALPGQALVIPKKPVAYLFDLEDDLYHHLFSIAKKVAIALDTTLHTERTCLVVEGFEVPHVHIKLYPMTSRQPLGKIIEETAPLAPEEGQALSEKLKTALN